MQFVSRREVQFFGIVLLFLVSVFGVNAVLDSELPIHASEEVGVATLSPLGEEGGFSIPASSGSCTRCADCGCLPPPPPPPPPSPNPPPPPAPTPPPPAPTPPPPAPTPPPPPPPGPPGSPPPPPPKQCADFVDNDDDDRIDATDPACHTDGNAANNSSYDPNIDTEVDLIITAEPRIIRSGDSTTVIWQATGAPLSCTVQGPGINETSMAGNADTGSLTEESFYVFSCDYGTFNRSASVRVVILPVFEEF